METTRITIFDTTLRDGEQSPGCSMNLTEKLRLARQIDLLGADVIEAGFPIASQGDYEAVEAIAHEIRRPRIAALARCRQEDIDRAWAAVKHAARPMLHVFLATSEIHLRHKLKMTREQCLRQSRTGCLRPLPYSRRGVFGGRRHAHGYRISDGRNLRRSRGGRHHGQPARYGGLQPAQRDDAHFQRSHSAHAPQTPARHPFHSLSRRPGTGGSQLGCRHTGRSTAGGMHSQRHRGTRRQRRPGGGRDGAERTARRDAVLHRHPSRNICLRPARC